MNETSATSASGMSLLPDSIATLTTIHFVLIAVLAILVILGILWGIRAKRTRVQASRDVIANAKEAGVVPEPAQRPAPSAPAPASIPSPRTSTQTQGQQFAPPIPATPPRSPTPSPTPTLTPPPVAPSPPPVADEIVAGIPEPMPQPADDQTAAQPTPPEARSETDAAADFAPIPAPILAPTPASASAPPAAHDFAGDPVTQLKGLGPKVATRLAELGVTTVGQMASLSVAEAQSIDAQLGNFTGRMGRDRWIEQARLLAAGDKAGFEAVFGKL